MAPSACLPSRAGRRRRTAWYAACVGLGCLPLPGCGPDREAGDSFARFARELDGIVASRSPAGKARIRELLGHEQADVRALAAEAAAAAGDWESLPALIALLDDQDRVVRGRSVAAIAVLLGRDHRFDPDAPPEERARFRRHVESCYEELRVSPPPKYRP